MVSPNLLETGIYTVSEAAYLVETTQQKVRGWISGYARRNAPPIIDNELGWLEGRLAFSFINLMEMRFIAFFEKAGVSFAHIRSIMDEVKVQLEHPHPFATDIVFRTDGRKIVAEIGRKNKIPQIFDLRTRNYEMRIIVLETLKDDVIFDPDGLARAWYPRRAIAPNVIMHPKISFGRPVLRDSRVPTQTIAEAFEAENRKARAVSDWFEVPERQVREAVKFEMHLRQAA